MVYIHKKIQSNDTMLQIDYLDQGLLHFAEQNYFLAHEDWETLWLKTTGAEKMLLQAMILLAGVGVHRQKNRSAPARRLHDLARTRLLQCKDDYSDNPLWISAWEVLTASEPEGILPPPLQSGNLDPRL